MYSSSWASHGCIAAACVIGSAGIREFINTVDPLTFTVLRIVAAAVVLMAVDKKVRREKLEVIGLFLDVVLDVVLDGAPGSSRIIRK
jgi:hypothetical protein